MAIARVGEFIGWLKPLSDKGEIQALCEGEMAYLESQLSLTSLRRDVSRYRNAIKELNKEHPALKFLKVSEEMQKIYRGNKAHAIAADQWNLIVIDAEALILRAETLLDATGYIRQGLGLCLLTGRRPVEILKKGILHYPEFVDEAIEAAAGIVPDYLVNTSEEIARQAGNLGTDDYLLFSGQAKTRDSKEAVRQPFPIPILTDVEKVMDTFKSLREKKGKDFANLTHDQIHNNTSKSWNNHETGCKNPRIFGDLIDAKKCSAKGLRAAYATIAHHYFNPNVGHAVYFSQILGHSPDSTDTAQSYLDFRLEA